jgi:multiple sugar transport system ATP-binding protein
VEQIGTPLDLYDRPANRFVAGFIGSPAMNFVEGSVEGAGFRDRGGALWPLPPGMPADRPAIYGVRPEHLRLASGGIPLKVRVLEPTGAETQVIGEIAGTPILGAFRERIAAAPGEVIFVGTDSNLVHLFDPETGERLSA